MIFAIYHDEEMTQLASSIKFQSVINNKNPVRGVVFFGSTDKNVVLKTRKNRGIDNITITPKFRLEEIERNKRYKKPLTNSIDYHLNGFIYKLIKQGITSPIAPFFSQEIGAEIVDGDCIWRCVSVAHKKEEIKLALSEKQLDNVAAGNSLIVAQEIKGGIAIPIFYEIRNSVENIYSDFNCPQLSFSINECIIESVENE